MECSHEQKEFRRKTFSNLTTHHAYQCLRCGDKVGNWLKHDDFPITEPGAIPAWDEELQDNWYASQRGAAKVKSDSEVLTSDPEYQEYLKSTEWHERRERVLVRDKHWCRGCHRHSASIVHHLTYDHKYNEFLWELISVCKDCHDRFHGRGDYDSNA